ncbi:MAG TPA: SurA N-terminal domain-containing protein, partial [Candidatus Omnitrophota bacterium]|nr:SurA N-terminal domain-containing protein [Candidatus Omnitrophota bacterium]
MRKLIIAAVILLTLNSHLKAEDKIIAVVNKDTITQSEAEVYLNILRLQISRQFKGKELEEKIEEEKKQLIEKMIEDRVIIQEAKRKNLTARPERVKFRIDEIKAGYQSEVDFENSIKEKGLTISDLEKKLNDQMIMRELIEREVKDRIIISPEEVTKFYEKNKNELFAQAQTYAIEAIYLEDEKIARDLERDLKGGLGFKESAQKHKASYRQDTIAKDQLRPEAQNELSRLSAGQVSQPIKIEEGIYFFKLIEILP